MNSAVVGLAFVVAIFGNCLHAEKTKARTKMVLQFAKRLFNQTVYSFGLVR